MVTEDEYLERVVAGIQAATSADADVQWNEVINGRQFDVVVRFQLGTMHYLVLIEVKNRTRRASAEDVEAFVTKADDQNASKAVFVTAAGFQQGAVTVARRHGLELFTVTFDQDEVDLATEGSITFSTGYGPGPPVPRNLRIEVGERQRVTAIEEVRLVLSDGSVFELPSEASQMGYYAEKSRLSDGRTLGDLMMSVPGWQPEVDEERKEQVLVEPPLRIVPPDDYYFPEGLLIRIELIIVGRMSRPLRGNVQIEASAFRCPVVYTNVLTGVESRYTLDQLPMNTGAAMPGRFYCQMHPLRYFYCDSRQGDLLRWLLIESFQNGQLIRSTFTQKVQYGAFYIPVRDKKILTRLEGRLSDYLALSGIKISPRPGFRAPTARGATRPKKTRRQRRR